MRILIVGGYGVFGGRIVQLLADEPRLTLIVAGRSREKAAEFCTQMAAKAVLVAERFDRGDDVEAQLRALAPDLIVDASGPFQGYGSQPYRLVEAAVALGVDYLDLADGSEFVAGIDAFDARAKARGNVVLSGVSSFPVLTAAVCRRLSADFSRLDTITGGIAPSPYAGVGLNVVRAISSYAGQKLPLTRGGRPASGYAFIETLRTTIGPPGQLPLKSTLFSLVDVPDLLVLPQEWPGLRSVWMGAGPVPASLHRALIGLAWLVRLRLLPSLSFLAPLFFRAINTLRWGEHRGGMFVRVEGAGRDGAKVSRSWHLLAEGDDGPLIPSMAVAAIVARCLAGRRPAPGARSAVADLELEDYEALFAARRIVTGVREEQPRAENISLYRRLLGTAFDALPQPIRDMHDGARVATGTASVERGSNLVARMIARTIGFPPAGRDVPVRVRFDHVGDGETWTRTFGDRTFSSVQVPGRGRADKLLLERFGPLSFGIALVSAQDRLQLVVRQWRIFGIPMPMALAPGGETYESAENGRFNFHVEIKLPVAGLLVRYRGWLMPEQQDAKVPALVTA